MPHSMTGFSTAEARVGSFRLVWEIRSVNHRFLELGFRLPEDLRAVEPDCRELVAAALKRGKVDCTLKIGADERAASRGHDRRRGSRAVEVARGARSAAYSPTRGR